MTYTTTHAAMSSFLLYVIAPKSLKQELKENKTLFFIFSIGAVIPDIDIIIGGHRSWSHSFFFPLMLALLAPLIAQIRPDRKNLTRNIRIFAFMYFTHIIFDFSFGALALFWPLDHRFYDVQMGIIINVVGNGLLPITIRGIYMDITRIDPTIGTDSFFINWTPTQRQQYFGSTITKLSIPSMPIHIVLFAWYFVEVFLGMLFQRSKYRSDTSSGRFHQYYTAFETTTKNLGKKFVNLFHAKHNWTLSLILISLIITSLMAGPLQGDSWKTYNNSSTSFWVMSDGMNLVGYQHFSVPSNAVLNLTVTYDYASFNYTGIIAEMNSSSAVNITSHLKAYTDAFGAGNMSLMQLFSKYNSYLSKNLTISEYGVSNNDIHFERSFFTNSSIGVLVGLYHWNATESSIKSVHYSAVWTFDRSDQVRAGWVFAWLFSIIMLVDLLIFMQKHLTKKVVSNNS